MGTRELGREWGEYKVAEFASREADSALSNGRSPEGIQSKIHL